MASSHGTRRRISLLVVLAACACLALTARLAWLMMARGEDLHARSLDERMRTVPVMAPRGEILDRAGRVLATSATVYAAYAVPAEVRRPARAAAALAPILDRPSAVVLARLRRRVALSWLARSLTDAQAAAVRHLGIGGVGLAPQVRRVYPYGSLLAEVIGFAGVDAQGLAGLELSYNRELQGRAGAIRVEYDARNQRIPQARTAYEPARSGDTLVTTLDVGLQEIAQEALRQAMANTGATSGLVLMTDVRTGGILALALAPSFDPANYARYAPVRWKDAAVSDTYPPGSTFKPITAAAALAAGVVTPRSGFYDPGFLRVDGRAIRCWKAGGHGPQSLAKVIQNSCNVGVAEIGLRLGTERFYRYLARFGLTGRTGVDLPGEARAILPRAADVKPVDLAVMAFGQTLALTPIQVVDAIGAIADGGRLLRPHLVSEVLSPTGRVLRTVPTEVLGRPISAAVAGTVAAMMENVTLYGSGKKAQVAGYRVAGKTGTSQVVVNGRYEPGQYIASFVGFAPLPDPRVLCLVVIDRPQGEHYGGQVAAPVFAQVMARALPYLGIAPNAPARAGKLPRVVPAVAGESPGEAFARLRAAGLRARRVGPVGARVAATLPAAGTVAANGRVLVFEGPRPVAAHRPEMAPVS
jgi:stage V sporulation protein D (sporulation-specific penicillin-binding protein)